MKNDKGIAPGMFRINPFKTYREDKVVPINQARASVRTNPITISQPHVITKKDVNFDSNGLSSTGVDIIAKTRRLQPRSNTKNDRVPFVSKSSCIKNKEFEVEDHHRNLLLSNSKKHFSSECNNIRLAIRNDKSEAVCATCKQCLITTIHDVCVLNYVNAMNSHVDNQNAKVLSTTNKKHKAKVKKPKKSGSKENLATPKPRNPRTYLRSKDEALKEIKTLLKKIQVLLQALIIIVRTDNGTEFKNQVLKEYFDDVDISRQMSSVKTPQQNEVVERRNRTLELDLTYAPSTITSQKPTKRKLDLLFKAMYNDYIGGQPSAAPRTITAASAPQVLQTPLDQPSEKHLKVSKRFFRYLQGTANMGLWYMKDSGFELSGFLDADYGGCRDSIKSTSGRSQF
nr:uncharacterized mitochondrial protein AtMg00810-like [Tanacetum cinerariifolium]